MRPIRAAKLTVLAGLVCASSAQAGYAYDGVTSYGSETVTSGNGNSYIIKFFGLSNGGLTWNYQVCETGDKSLSHFVLDMCTVPTGHSGPGTYTDEHVNGQADPTTGQHGVKWDLPDNYDNTGGKEDDCAFFSVTFDKVFGVTDIAVAVKTGGQGVKYGFGTILGPDCCEECTPTTGIPTPGAAAAGMALLGLVGLRRRRNG